MDQQGPLIKADWGLSTVSPSVQQRHSVWDYHTCGSGINPSRDMGTRNRGLLQSSVQRGGGGDIPGLCPHEPKVDGGQLVAEVLWLNQVYAAVCLKTLTVADKAQNSKQSMRR